MTARLCPHCNVRSNFTPRVGHPGKWGPEENQLVVVLEIEQCHNCGGLIVLKFLENNQGRGEESVFPASIPSVDASIPDRVANDFISGVSCLSINETKAAATMFRRSLQQLAIDRRAEGNTLFDQLNWLQSNTDLPQSVIDWANEIRFWGNSGAHPNEDGLDEISMDAAKEIKAFIERVFEWVYIMPARVEGSRANRQT